MGNVDSRSKHEHGHLVLQTAKPFYYPGEFITGSIFIRVFHQIEARHVEI